MFLDVRQIAHIELPVFFVEDTLGNQHANAFGNQRKHIADDVHKDKIAGDRSPIIRRGKTDVDADQHQRCAGIIKQRRHEIGNQTKREEIRLEVQRTCQMIAPELAGENN